MPTNPFLLNLECRDDLSPAERDLARVISGRRRVLHAEAEIIHEGESATESCLILSGLAARYNLLDSGRRQITAVHIAGEFVDLHSFLLSRMDHSVVTLTECTVSMVPHSLLRQITETQPHFTRLLWLLTLVDSATYRQWLVAAGRLSAAGQIAHFLCEIFVKSRVVGLVNGNVLPLPISQSELSDAMGLSVVHVNRTLQVLRRKGLIAWHGSEVRILDWEGLSQLGEFNPLYLDLGKSPR